MLNFLVCLSARDKATKMATAMRMPYQRTSNGPSLKATGSTSSLMFSFGNSIYSPVIAVNNLTPML
jgi:hypothetical protein